MKWNINIAVGFVAGSFLILGAGLGALSLYWDTHRTVELPPPCEVIELPPRAEYGTIFLRIPNATKCGTDASVAALKKYVDFESSMTDIRDFKIIVDAERAGYLITFETPNGYWRHARQK